MAAPVGYEMMVIIQNVREGSFDSRILESGAGLRKRLEAGNDLGRGALPVRLPAFGGSAGQSLFWDNHQNTF
jgi:hypothetical protein